MLLMSLVQLNNADLSLPIYDNSKNAKINIRKNFTVCSPDRKFALVKSSSVKRQLKTDMGKEFENDKRNLMVVK
jgi:hypothetical protein